MIYFINFGMPAQKSGIEHAELKRLRLFEQHDQPCQIVVQNWDRTLHVTAGAAGVDDDHLLGMFDYYQGTRQVQSRPLKLADLDLGLSDLATTQESDRHRYLLKRPSGLLAARVNYDDQEQVTSTELFDGYGNLYRVDNYDSRGFKSLVQWYTPDNKIGNEEWLDREGRVVIRNFHKYNPEQKLVTTGWQVTDPDGQVYVFNTMTQFFGHFLNALNQTGKNIFILDRALLADEALLHLDRPAYTVLHLHNSQSSDAQQPLTSIPNNNYEYALANINRYSAVISATARQTKDVIARYHPTADMYTIPVGIVPDAQLAAPRVPMKDRTFGKIIAVARIAYEKRLDDLVRAVKLVHDQVPEVRLDLYGYADTSHKAAEKRKVAGVIKDLGLEQVVTFKGYSHHIDEVYDSAQIFGLTSRMEGFDLAIMEASSHGVVGVTYDVNYGPNDIIVNGKNGYVVDNGDYHQLADRMLQLFRDPTLLQSMSDGAYELSERFSTAQVWAKWQELIDQAMKDLGGQK